MILNLWRKHKKMVKALEELREVYSNLRSGVSDTVDAILDGTYSPGLAEKNAEHRYVEFVISGVKYQYDTLTTLVEYYDPFRVKWKTVPGITYSGD